MQADPRLGILQSLVIGMPSASAFARIFQFGMRLGMRSYTIGSAWWQGDCGPYWGHNAIVRIAPFCSMLHLPVLDRRRARQRPRSQPRSDRGGADAQGRLRGPRAGGRRRRASSRTRQRCVEFIRRDLRWCQGNMQYWHFLRHAGPEPVSRYQLAFAILMFLGSPAWIGIAADRHRCAVASARRRRISCASMPELPPLPLVLAMWFAPNIATVDRRARARRSCAACSAAAFASPRASPSRCCSSSCSRRSCGPAIRLFLVRLLLGRTVGWSAQVARRPRSAVVAGGARTSGRTTLIGLAPIVLLA